MVDGAIVVVENIYRHIEDGSSPFEAAIQGSREIGFTVLSISLSLVAVFILGCSWAASSAACSGIR